jgi:protein required for attachment to host cells
MKKDTWILVANSSCAKIYKVEKNLNLVELEVLEHPESRQKDADLVSSKPGRQFDSLGMGRHAYQQQTSPKLQEFETFARQLAELLDNAREKGLFGKLYLAANPSFLGILRPLLSISTEQLIAGEVDKDMTQLKAQQIREHFPLVM